MRKSFVALLLIGAAALMASPALAIDDLDRDMGLKLLTAGEAKEKKAGTGLTGTSTGTVDPETLWVGYWAAAPASNPFKVGALPQGSGNLPLYNTEGMWDFDTPVNGDSLMGWWSIRDNHTNFSGATRTDENRPWWANPFGNIANHAGNPGGGTSRVFGVTGVWHQDAGNLVAPTLAVGQTGPAPARPNFAPFGGSGLSAYMGLRAHHDITYSDPVTGNAYNFDIIQFYDRSPAAPGRADGLYPGYIGDMDQILYKDINTASYDGSGLSISFQYATSMSTNKDTDARFRTGWHEGDGLSQNSPTAGNFISAEAGVPANAQAPIDSFQVYIGAPVETEWKTSRHPADISPALVAAGVLNPATGRRIVQDSNRRWFNEVLMKDARRHVFGVAGTNNPTGWVASGTITIPHATVQAMIDSAANDGIAGTNGLRIAFRVHTNRAFDDQAGSVAGNYNSSYAGAAQLDNVLVENTGNGTDLLNENFNTAGAINNGSASAWKSTGKPPATFFHPHDIATLTYEDVCGPVGDPERQCNLAGVVMSGGLHDQADISVDPVVLSTDHEGNWGIVSPTINLAGGNQLSKDPTKNDQNMSASERFATGEYFNWYETYTGVNDIFVGGQLWHFGFMSYPARQSDGVRTWGPITVPGFIIFNPEKNCFSDFNGGFINSLILSTNLSDRPDSLRMYFGKISQCYRFGVTNTCASTDGFYFDNISMGILDGTPAFASADIWDLFNDSYPVNETAGLPGTANFDTAAAHIKSGLNIAPSTLDGFRPSIGGDSILVLSIGDSIRMDFMFRILPGVGNYKTVGNPNSGLRSVITNGASAAVSPGDGTFFGSYMASPGAFSGLPGAINPAVATAAHAGAASDWNPIVWNSARIDTSQLHPLFPNQRRNVGLRPAGTEWSSTYHEDELAARPTLGIARNRCFQIDTSTANTQNPNLNCGGDPAKGAYPPAWVTFNVAYTGYNGSTTTTEGTKVIPDGLLTPGSHVQYFVRRQSLRDALTVFSMVPDTTVVSPQQSEGSTDGHRWQQFSVLPDRWKDGAFTDIYGNTGAGMACMLVYDNNDRRGNERVWKGVADSIGATSATDRGNADGYGGAPGTGATTVNAPAYRIANRNKSFGTQYDMYQMKASESFTTGAGAIGSRTAPRPVTTGYLFGSASNGKFNYTAPTPETLDAYYRIMVVLTGDLNFGQWGPYPGDDREDDDLGTFINWLQGGADGNERGMLTIGDGFVENAVGSYPAHVAYVATQLATEFVNENYYGFTGDVRDFIPVHADRAVNSPLTPSGYSANNNCLLTNDIVDRNVAVAGSQLNIEYIEDALTFHGAGVFKPDQGADQYISQTVTMDIESMRGAYGTTLGRLLWVNDILVEVFGSICTLAGSPVLGLDQPNIGSGNAFVDFLNLRNNPLRSGQATVHFGLAADDQVQVKVYDVSGRLVRTLADRKFKAGEHTLTWDGVDNAGRSLPRGVYFTQVKFMTRNVEMAKKITILR